MLEYQKNDLVESDSSSGDNADQGVNTRRQRVDYPDAEQISPFDANLIKGVLT